MGMEKKLLLEIGERIGLDDEIFLFETLGKLAKQWAALARNVDGFDTALALINAAIAAPDDPAVVAAFAKLEADDELQTIREAAQKLGAIIKKIPEPVKKLLAPVGQFDERTTPEPNTGVVHWPLLAETFGAAPAAVDGKPSYSLSVEAGAALTVEAGDSWPYQRDAVPGPLLRIEAAGHLKPKASAKLPFTGGSVAASAEADGSASLRYYFALPDPGQIYALAVAERATQLVDPFDFDAIWDGFAYSDLRGVHYQFDGSAAVDVSVSLADAGAIGTDIKAEIGASLSVGFGLAGKYFLSLRAGPKNADGQPQIIAGLSREKQQDRSLAAKVGATLDLGGVAAKVHAILEKGLGKWDDLLQDMTLYLSPGTLLRDKAKGAIEKAAKALVADQELRDALAGDLQLLVTGDESDPALVKWLSGKLSDALDKAQNWAESQADAVDGIVDDLGRTLPSFAIDSITEKLRGTTDTLIGEARGLLDQKVKELFQNKGREFGNALHEVGATTGKKLDDLDEAFDGVRKLIARYDALFRKLLAATEDAVRAKISIAVQLEEARLESETMEVRGSFLARSDKARRIFRALTRGEFATLFEVMEAADGAFDFLLDRSDSSLTRYADSTGKFGMELVLFGFGISGRELLSGKATATVDGTGKVRIDAEGRFERQFSAFDADREIELVSSYSLVRARALASAPDAADRSLGLAITIGHIDEGLKRREVRRFINSLVEAELVAKTALDTADATFTRWIGDRGADGKFSGALQVKMSLTRADLERLLSVSKNREDPLPLDRPLTIVRTAFEMLEAGAGPDAPKIEAAKAMLAAEKPKLTLDHFLMNPAAAENTLSDDTWGHHPSLRGDFEPFRDNLRRSHGMLEMIEQMRKIYYSNPETAPDDDRNTWRPVDYRKAEREAVKAVREWLQLNNKFAWTDSEVHPRTIAFLKTLLELAGTSARDRLSLVMWHKDPKATPETLLLSSPRVISP